MFFFLSKTLAPLQQPSEVLLLLLLAGLGLGWFVRTRRIGLALASFAGLCFAAVAVLPVADWVTAPLENRFPRPLRMPEPVDGIIVLGGAVDPLTTFIRGLPTLNSEAERMTEFVRLARFYPKARLVFSGGTGLHKPLVYTEADVARFFLAQQGIGGDRLVLEGRARDTYENVLFSKALVKPRPGEHWLLVQSARDVPRAMGIFRKLGWPVTPVPVAYKTNGLPAGVSFIGNMGQLDRAVHEWLGLVAYRLAGRTDTLFPGP